jgi:hypothetical protein
MPSFTLNLAANEASIPPKEDTVVWSCFVHHLYVSTFQWSKLREDDGFICAVVPSRGSDKVMLHELYHQYRTKDKQ